METDMEKHKLTSRFNLKNALLFASKSYFQQLQSLLN